MGGSWRLLMSDGQMNCGLGEMASEAATSADPGGVRRRPRNRKALIVDAAIVLFHRDGYARVGMEGIASAVGITAGALYRHFRGKQELLYEAMLTVIDEHVSIASAAAPAGLEAMLRSIARQAIDGRDRGALWQRNVRELSPEQRTRVRHRLRALAGRVADVIAQSRPELPQPNTDLLAWAVMAVLSSPYEHGVTLAKPRFEDL